jgi:hypothetical protein
MFRAVQLYDQYLIGRELGEKKALYKIMQELTQQNYTDSQIAQMFSMTESELADLRANPPIDEWEFLKPRDVQPNDQ